MISWSSHLPKPCEDETCCPCPDEDVQGRVVANITAGLTGYVVLYDNGQTALLPYPNSSQIAGLINQIQTLVSTATIQASQIQGLCAAIDVCNGVGPPCIPVTQFTFTTTPPACVPVNQFSLVPQCQPVNQFGVQGQCQPVNQFGIQGQCQPASQFNITGNCIPVSQYTFNTVL